MSPRKCTNKTPHAFTLVEILIVVVILGILAAIVVPRFSIASTEAQQTGFVADVKSFASAAWYYMNKEGVYLEDSSSGVCPTGWEPYIDENKWTRPTTIGGVWDFELNSFGITSGFGVHFYGNSGNNPGDAYMTEIDAMFDDGNLTTGGFRKLDDDRYYYILVN